MRKEFGFQGCMEVPVEFLDEFVDFIVANGWSFVRGINTIIDGFYINHDGTKGMLDYFSH